MRTPAALLFLLFLMGAWIASAPAVHAQLPIHHCVSATGDPVFTDRSCADLRATPVTNTPASATAPHQGVPQKPPPILCARNNQQLRQSVIEAFANHDPNQLAGLMLWSGYGHRAAIADIESLRAAMRQPLLDLDDPDDTPATAATAPTTEEALPTAPNPPPPDTPPPAPQLVVHTVGTDGSGSPHELRFDIIPRDGCLWLGHAD